MPRLGHEGLNTSSIGDVSAVDQRKIVHLRIPHRSSGDRVSCQLPSRIIVVIKPVTVLLPPHPCKDPDYGQAVGERDANTTRIIAIHATMLQFETCLVVVRVAPT